MTCLNNVNTGALSEFREIQRRVECRYWITSTPIWVKLLKAKEDGGGKSESGDGSILGKTKWKVEA